MAWTLPISVLSSEFTRPAWLIFGTRLESLLRCAHCERLSLKHEMVNNVSVDISPGDSPSLRDALVAYEAEGNMDAEDDLPCTRWKMAGARTKELSTVGRRARQERPKSPKTRPIRLLSCATKTCLGVTSCEVSLHQGDERKSGHYTCSGRNGPSWHYFDDSSMREVSSRTVLALQAYMLMYERV